ncbi:type III pantothenate kinase [Arcticibacterium luteifluviistationis]|nr:type III pantothenate kinase [Arcticibacterium luteifluviistationis]
MLVADIGNTDILFGIFEGDQLKHTYRIPSIKDEGTMFFEYGLHNFFLENNISPNQFQKTVLSSVVPELTHIIEDILNRLSTAKTIVVKPGIHPEVSVDIENPDELGSDLYCNAVSAFKSSQSACIVVDFGTALTFTAVSNKGEVLGVAITPGLKTAVHALFSKTSQLPEVPLELPEKAIGRNTLKSIQSGVLYGYEGLVRNLLIHFKKEIGTPCKVFATGGLSSILKGLQSEFDDVDVNLTLKGLKVIGEEV